MTLTGLVTIMFAILVVVIIVVFIMKLCFCPLAHDILEDFLWYKNSTKIWRHVYQYIFSFGLIAFFIAFLISICFLAEWGNTIILW